MHAAHLSHPLAELERRDEFIANLEAEKEKNLQVKLGIIEELKELVNSDERILNYQHVKNVA